MFSICSAPALVQTSRRSIKDGGAQCEASSRSGMGERCRKRSVVTSLVTPLLTISRKLSRSRERRLGGDSDCYDSDRVAALTADYPQEFVSQMKEVFKEFDKVKCKYFQCMCKLLLDD